MKITGTGQGSIWKRIRRDGVVFFGAGDFARCLYQDFAEELDVKYCITNNPAESAFFVDGKEICPVYRVTEKIAEIKEMIIVCARACAPMMDQLFAYGLRFGMDFIDSELYRVLLSEKKTALFYGVCYSRAILNCLKESEDFMNCYNPVSFLHNDYFRLLNSGRERMRLFFDLADLYVGVDTMSPRDAAFLSHLKPGCQIIRLPLAIFNGFHPRGRI